LSTDLWPKRCILYGEFQLTKLVVKHPETIIGTMKILPLILLTAGLFIAPVRQMAAQDLSRITNLPGERSKVSIPEIELGIQKALSLRNAFPDSASALLQLQRKASEARRYKNGLATVLLSLGSIYLLDKENPVLALHY